MAQPKRGLCLLLVLVSLSSGCAATGRYPFREKPRPPAAAEPEKGDLEQLQKDLLNYAD